MGSAYLIASARIGDSVDAVKQLGRLNAPGSAELTVCAMEAESSIVLTFDHF
jgi:hypothetical protein